MPSERKKLYTSAALPTLAWLRTQSALKSTLCFCSTSMPCMTLRQVPAPCLVEAVEVVDSLGAVDRDADQPVVRLEELAPAVVEQDAVGLHRVATDWPLRPYCC